MYWLNVTVPPKQLMHLLHPTLNPNVLAIRGKHTHPVHAYVDQLPALLVAQCLHHIVILAHANADMIKTVIKMQLVLLVQFHIVIKQRLQPLALRA